MIHTDTCVLWGEDKPCVEVEHLGPVCVDDIAEAAETQEFDEGSDG